MAKCDTCKHKTTEDGLLFCDCCIHEQSMGDRYEPFTNADRIRAMDDEKLAELLLDGCRGSFCDEQAKNEYGSADCFQCRLNWLQQPCEEGTK